MTGEIERRWLTMPHDDVCRVCGCEIHTGDRALHVPSLKVFKNLCVPCGENFETLGRDS